jgi:microcystin-dependent protein
MATVTGLTAEKMLEIEGNSIVEGEIRPDGHLWLIQRDGDPIDAGPVIGPQGPIGPMGPSGVASIPGEVKLWSGGALPSQGLYGKWVWADGAVYVTATYPIAAGHIATQWRTAHGASDPGAGNFRVPDMRGVAPVGLDAMPGGARANRMTRAVAITLAGRTGEETHVVTVNEMAVHGHTVNAHNHGGGNHTHGGNVMTGGDPGPPSGYGGTQWNPVPYSGDVVGWEAPGTNNIGGNSAHENVQPTIFVPYIVRLDG